MANEKQVQKKLSEAELELKKRKEQESKNVTRPEVDKMVKSSYRK